MLHQYSRLYYLLSLFQKIITIDDFLRKKLDLFLKHKKPGHKH